MTVSPGKHETLFATRTLSRSRCDRLSIRPNMPPAAP